MRIRTLENNYNYTTTTVLQPGTLSTGSIATGTIDYSTLAPWYLRPYDATATFKAALATYIKHLKSERDKAVNEVIDLQERISELGDGIVVEQLEAERDEASSKAEDAARALQHALKHEKALK